MQSSDRRAGSRLVLRLPMSSAVRNGRCLRSRTDGRNACATHSTNARPWPLIEPRPRLDCRTSVGLCGNCDMGHFDCDQIKTNCCAAVHRSAHTFGGHSGRPHTASKQQASTVYTLLCFLVSVPPQWCTLVIIFPHFNKHN